MKIFILTLQEILLKCLFILNDSSIDISKDNLSCILYLMEKYKNKKDSELLIFISLFIERFYNQLCLNNNNKNSASYFINRSKILKSHSRYEKI